MDPILAFAKASLGLRWAHIECQDAPKVKEAELVQLREQLRLLKVAILDSDLSEDLSDFVDTEDRIHTAEMEVAYHGRRWLAFDGWARGRNPLSSTLLL